MIENTSYLFLIEVVEGSKRYYDGNNMSLPTLDQRMSAAKSCLAYDTQRIGGALVEGPTDEYVLARPYIENIMDEST